MINGNCKEPAMPTILNYFSANLKHCYSEFKQEEKKQVEDFQYWMYALQWKKKQLEGRGILKLMFSRRTGKELT